MPKGSASPGEVAVINGFIAHLNKARRRPLRISKRPDRSNRTTQDIDAIAGCLAIEHTSIDTVDQQRRDNARFMSALGDLESEINWSFPYRLSINIDYSSIAEARNLRSLKQAFKNWILNSAPDLPEGRRTISGAAGIPLQFIAEKALDRKPMLITSRTEPVDPTLSDRARTLIDRKAGKLAPYKWRLKRRVLLVESEDIALMNQQKLVAAIRAAYVERLPPGVDAIWFADTGIPSDLEYYDITEAVSGRTPRSPFAWWVPLGSVLLLVLLIVVWLGAA